MTLWKVQLEVVATKAKNPHQYDVCVNVAGNDDITSVCGDIVKYVHRRGIGDIQPEKVVQGMVYVREISKVATIHVNALNGGFMAVSEEIAETLKNHKSE